MHFPALPLSSNKQIPPCLLVDRKEGTAVIFSSFANCLAFGFVVTSINWNLLSPPIFPFNSAQAGHPSATRTMIFPCFSIVIDNLKYGLCILKFRSPNGVLPELVRKTKFPQETIMEQDDSKNEEQEESENSNEPIDVLDGWEELQDVLEGATIDEVFEKGWKPVLRTKPNGKQYMVIRLHGRDPETGKYRDTERGLGLHTSERWDTLVALYQASKPALPSIMPAANPLPSVITENQSTTQTNRSTVLTTKVARVTPIGPSVQINLGTLQWYNWVQVSKGYPGTLDDFINQSVEILFTDHYNKEIAVVDKTGVSH